MLLDFRESVMNITDSNNFLVCHSYYSDGWAHDMYKVEEYKLLNYLQSLIDII